MNGRRPFQKILNDMVWQAKFLLATFRVDLVPLVVVVVSSSAAACCVPSMRTNGKRAGEGWQAGVPLPQEAKEAGEASQESCLDGATACHGGGLDGMS